MPTTDGKTFRTAKGVETLVPPEYANHEEYESALRAEIERLTAERIAFMGQGPYSHFQEMERELNGLDMKLGNALRAIGLEHAENERLRAALQRIQQWDMINPPSETMIWRSTDFPWLKRLVDDALAPPKAS